ncbi:hypothetical protein ICNINCKA_00083 [Synechococcus sp. CBW1107]|nr:hypothetical protein ICNINCKA_00083 [Synechococcus sp. CBW1107]
MLQVMRQPVDILRNRFSSKAIILMYHRVAEVSQDPWALAVTPKNFNEHLRIIRQQAIPLKLHELVQAQQEGGLPDRVVAVTFDDGYSDNFYNAAPLLNQSQIPATIFTVTGYTGTNCEFWWDELARILLQPRPLPPFLELTLAGKPQTWHLGMATDYHIEDMERDRCYKAWEAPPDSRLGFYYRVWAHLRPLLASQQKQAIVEIQAWANDTSITRSSCRPMTMDQIIRLDQGGLITIGAHTVSHPLLSKHQPAVQKAELLKSKHALETWLNRPVTLFAYPFGDYAQETREIAREVGFCCACTTQSQRVSRGSDLFQLPRYGVENCSGDEFAQKLSAWFSR